MGRRKRERETPMYKGNIGQKHCLVLPLTHPQPGTWPATWACAPTGNELVTLGFVGQSPLSHTSQGHMLKV